jgi:beta-galactosidase
MQRGLKDRTGTGDIAFDEVTVRPSLLTLRHRSHRGCKRSALWLMCVGASLCSLQGQTSSAIFIDASAPASDPVPARASLGTSTRPDGETFTINSQYLLLNGKPWLPVMGEFHYSRYPESEWETEILKMKASGVQIISTYVFWIHQEEVKGHFDWSGQRDLRHFVELCGKHGLYVYPRIGPWAHGEVRNGGLPDWVLKAGPTRQNDPVYLAEVQIFYSQIGEQLKRLLWKDGGPVIGIQLENEYRGVGPEAGAAHIEKLKQLAIAAGMDVPLYTVTGWDGAAVPLDAVLPVFGGYPAAPWERSYGQLPPSEIYMFRFHNRVAGDMSAMGGSGQNSAEAYRGTPFLTAEVGGGIEDTYVRRPVIKPDDIAAIAPVMLGSGANLLGFYMFHGGRNPGGRLSTLEESQRTGYPTDVPVKSYDFQAPISEFGVERESLDLLKLVNYFLNDFGSMLAPMQVYAPARVPANPADTSVARISARAQGDRAFLFFSNYVRGLAMAPRSNFQVHLKLPGGTMNVPTDPIQMPAEAYGIWPVNMDLGGYKLAYSTAQLFKLFKKAGDSYYFFFGISGISSEFAIETTRQPLFTSKGITTSLQDGFTYFRITNAAHQEELVLQQDRHTVHLIVMPRAQAEDLWNLDDSNLVLTDAQFFSDGDRLHLRKEGDPNFIFSVFGKDQHGMVEAAVPVERVGDGRFTQYQARVASVSLQITTPIQIQRPEARTSQQNGPPMGPNRQSAPLAPDDSDFGQAAVWRLVLPSHWADVLNDVFLDIDYRGDVARIYRGSGLLDDNFWNGTPWKVGLKELGVQTAGGDLQLKILPLPAGYRMYLEGGEARKGASKGNDIALKEVRLIPQYQLVLKLKQ